MQRNHQASVASGEVFTWRSERKYVPGFIGESLLYMFRPHDGSPRFTMLVSIPSSLIPRMGPDFDRLVEGGWPHAERELRAGVRSDLRIELQSGQEPIVTPAHGLRKFPLPGADEGELGSWG
jgi:hypothetical protein